MKKYKCIANWHSNERDRTHRDYALHPRTYPLSSKVKPFRSSEIKEIVAYSAEIGDIGEVRNVSRGLVELVFSRKRMYIYIKIPLPEFQMCFEALKDDDKTD